MEKIKVLYGVLLALMLCFVFYGCGEEDNTDYGTLTVENVILSEGEEKTIVYSFSKPEKAEEITYYFSGSDIEIKDSKVKALKGGKTVTVTAKTEHHETTFQVTTLVDYGSLEISDVYAWVGYPRSDIDVKFENPEYAEDLEYSYDNTAIDIDAETNTVTALSEGDVRVTATSEHFKTTFIVHAQVIDKSSDNYNTSNYTGKVAGYKSEWESKGRDGLTTLFIGDSFFDSGFWSNFYNDYAGKDVLRAGVSSSTSCDWEIFTETYLKYTNPKNIVMHMGTNNVYDDGMGIFETVSALQRMFYLIHEQLPDAHVYYFNISQRTYGDSKIGIVSSVNRIMEKWCANREWITLIDTSSQLSSNMLRDGVHPKNEYYYVFVDALAKTDIVIENTPVAKAVSFTNSVYDKSAGTYSLSAEKILT